MHEIYPTEDRLRHVFNQIEAHVEKKYSIPIIIKEVPSPFTGDLNGEEIHVDYYQDIENAVFIIAHLFGHTVQWNLCPRAREIGVRGIVPLSEDEMLELREYEKEACRYSLQLFHEAGIKDLDQWLSDFSACDFAYLDYVYKNGDKKPFRDFWKFGQELLTPLTIPKFETKAWVSRWQGIVV